MPKDLYAATDYATEMFNRLVAETFTSAPVTARNAAKLEMTNGTTPEAPNAL